MPEEIIFKFGEKYCLKYRSTNTFFKSLKDALNVARKCDDDFVIQTTSNQEYQEYQTNNVGSLGILGWGGNIYK